MLSIFQQDCHPIFSEGLDGAVFCWIDTVVVKVGNNYLSGLVRTWERKFHRIWVIGDATGRFLLTRLHPKLQTNLSRPAGESSTRRKKSYGFRLHIQASWYTVQIPWRTRSGCRRGIWSTRFSMSSMKR